MTWKEIKPGLWQRPLGGTEPGMTSVVASAKTREPLRIQAWVDFTVPYPTGTMCAAFEEAWKALRLLKSPDVATTFKDGMKCYQVPSQKELDQWVEQTYDFTNVGMSVADAIAKSHEKLSPMPLLVLLPQFVEKENTFKGTLLLLISHWRTEASGAYKMLDQLIDYALDTIEGSATIQALDKHKSGDEVKLLTPVADDIWMPNTMSTPEAKVRVEKHFKQYYDSLPALEVSVTGNLNARPTNNKAFQRVYTPASTALLVNACKTNAISVTSAVHSAYLGAAWAVASPDKKNRPYASLMPAQVRKRLPASSLYRDNGCWDAARPLMLTVPVNLGFLARAQALSKQYALADSDTWLKADLREVARQLASPPPGTPPIMNPLTPWFTSFGVLDGDVISPIHGKLKASNVSAWADNVGPGIVLTVWTFDGNLNIQISWNMAYHVPKQIDEVMELIDKEFKNGLGLDMKVLEVRGRDALY